MPLGELAAGVAARRRSGTSRRRCEIAARDDDEVVLLAHLLGDGSFVTPPADPLREHRRGQPRCRRSAAPPVRHHRGARRVRRRAGDHAAPARAVPPDPRQAEPDRRLARRARALRAAQPREVRARLGVRPAEGAGRHCSCATSGPPTAPSRYDEKRTGGRIYYASTSRRLVDDLARLLLRFNVFTRIKRVRKAGLPRRLAPLHLRRGEPAALPATRSASTAPAASKAERSGRAARGTSRPNTNLDTVPSEVWDGVREDPRPSSA